MTIKVQELVKEFRRPKRKSGRFTALRTLFSHEYASTRAVDGVDFSIEPGELIGYIGPNGAGKSTTIKMLTGILVPTSGTVEVAGVVPWRERERNARQIGVVFGQRTGLWWDLPLRDSLELVRPLYDLPRQRFLANLETFAGMLGLDQFMDVPVRQLSLGQRMRGDLAAAMLHEPQILYLDEPTVGLDIVAKRRIREFLSRLNRDAGTTVILTTHDLDDVEELCTRVILVDHGKVLYDGDVAELKRQHAPHHELIVHLAEPAFTADIPDVQRTRREDGFVTLTFDPARIAAADLISNVLAVHRVTDLSIVRPKLEDVVADIYAERSP
ncbi:ABC transporter ATP-binding protein [Nonomuraea diastatica]|uniref:ABC transporter ATP-binding protein n=1 Tax=Nonomuraea diastatica TaxID=1848329 RepID=A0A4R4W8N6_9ACTN|nr:ATP-binding cassette domain-containing protein [Nonomuraea diastatica]TDD15089.1 ABC transporter ATP-binding protein [Nonomuraea diastatica]